MDTTMYNPFVMPFAFGVVILFLNLIISFVTWLYNLSKTQRKQVGRHIISWRTLAAIWECLRECLLHRNIFKRNPVLGYMHCSLAFGWFLLIIVGKFEASTYSGSFFTNPWLAIFFRYFEDPSRIFPHKELFTFLMDFLLAVVLSGLLLAVIKRFYSRLMGLKKATRHTPSDRIALISLWCIFPLRLVAESLVAGYRNNGGFLTQSLGNLLAPFNLPIDPIWWAYSIALCLFFIFMPFTRYMHIFTEILLIFLRKWGVVEEDKKTGYTDVELAACSRCGICIDVCPLNTAAKINDTQSVYFIRDIRDNVISHRIINDCLLCNRCVEACPVGIKSTKIRQIYREKKSFENKQYYDYLNPAATGSTTSGNKSPKVLYFAGCMSHLTPGIIDSMKKIFKAAGEDFVFVDEDKNICCGRPLRQQGFLDQANTLMAKNVQLFNSYNAEILVTSCPICYNSFKTEYKDLNIKVMHHTQYINMLIEEGRLQVNHSDKTFAYHDPCEISREENRIFEEPRNILRAAGTLLPLTNEKADALCCGSSLGNTVLSTEQIEDIRNQAMDVLTKDNPDYIVTSCPLCKKTFKKGLRNGPEVKDIAEIIIMG